MQFATDCTDIVNIVVCMLIAVRQPGNSAAVVLHDRSSPSRITGRIVNRCLYIMECNVICKFHRRIILESRCITLKRNLTKTGAIVKNSITKERKTSRQRDTSQTFTAQKSGIMNTSNLIGNLYISQVGTSLESKIINVGKAIRQYDTGQIGALIEHSLFQHRYAIRNFNTA